MLFLLKKLVYTFTLNFSFLLLLIIGIQNSTKKESVNFIVGKTVNLPISFIIGVSFISGSITGGLVNTNLLVGKKSEL